MDGDLVIHSQVLHKEASTPCLVDTVVRFLASPAGLQGAEMQTIIVYIEVQNNQLVALSFGANSSEKCLYLSIKTHKPGTVRDPSF